MVGCTVAGWFCEQVGGLSGWNKLMVVEDSYGGMNWSWKLVEKFKKNFGEWVKEEPDELLWK